MIADSILAMYSNESTLWLLLSVFMGYHTCSGNSNKDLLGFLIKIARIVKCLQYCDGCAPGY